MSKARLNTEERKILEEFEGGKFHSQLTSRRVRELQSAAEETLRKDRRINIRISSKDLEGLQRRALEEGMPYQTLVSSVLHKYVSGSLQDIAANKPRKKDVPGRASS